MLPGHKDLQLLSEQARPFDRKGWLFELKYDGFRILVIRRGEAVKMLTRRGIDLSGSFPEITADLQKLPDCVLDGELVVLDDRGMPQFDALAARSRKQRRQAIALAAAQTPAAYFAFDLLMERGEDLRQRPLIERKARLVKLLGRLPRVKYLEHIADEGTGLFAAAEKLGMEGIVAKNGASRYRGMRSPDWVKVRTAAAKDVTRERGDSWYGGPKGKPAMRTKASVTRPEVGTVEVDGKTLQLTNLNKVLWPASGGLPAFTKGEYLTYLTRMAPHILRYIADRPLTLTFMPDGLRGRRFLEMHWDRETPAFVEKVAIFSGNKGGEHRYVLCNNRASLLWLANAGVLEFHPWHSRISAGPDAHGAGMRFTGSLRALEQSVLNRPDYIVFDIDSYIYSGREAKGAEPEYDPAAFAKCRQGALRIRALLERVSLTAFVKTSGKTGLHVIAPVERTMDFKGAREISRRICAELMRESPEDFTMDWSVGGRAGRVFLDYGMNARAKSLAAPFCPRAIPGAFVSMPLTWQELESVEPDAFRMDNVAALVERSGDPWADLLTAPRSKSRTDRSRRLVGTR